MKGFTQRLSYVCGYISQDLRAGGNRIHHTFWKYYRYNFLLNNTQISSLYHYMATID